MVAAVERARAETVVDVGSGDGMLVVELSRVAPTVLGLDIDPKQIEASTREFASNPRVRFDVGDLLSATPSGAPFDAVVCSATLHHVPLEAGLNRLAELTAPGGLLVIVGLANDTTVVDVVRSKAKAPIVRLMRSLRGWHDHGSTRHDPTDSWAAVASAVEKHLPGATFRRRFYWRYTVEWRKPTSA